METRNLGSLEVSLAGLGCNNFGRRINEAQTHAVVDAALESGINFFDTADVYGGGLSEEFLGKALGNRRDQVLIATKFGHGEGDKRGGSARWIAEAVEASLKRLGTDRIDLYQMHVPDDEVPIEETLEALTRLVKDGKVIEIGCSNFTGDQISKATEAAGSSGLHRFVSAQNHYSLMEREVEKEVLPACATHGLGMLPYFPLANGLLTGKYRKGEAAPEGTRLAALPADRASSVFSEENFATIERLEDFASANGRTILEVALCWLACQPTVASVIAGATKPEQVKANAKAVDWKLSPEALSAINDLVQ